MAGRSGGAATGEGLLSTMKGGGAPSTMQGGVSDGESRGHADGGEELHEGDGRMSKGRMGQAETASLLTDTFGAPMPLPTWHGFGLPWSHVQHISAPVSCPCGD